MLGRSHASLKQALRIETVERLSMWLEDVTTAVLNYNTSYRETIGSELIRVFHGRIPYKVLDWGKSICPQKTPTMILKVAQDVREQLEMIFHDVRKNTKQAYINYKA